MSSYRRPRDSMVEPARPGWLIEQSSKDRIEKLADHLHMSASEFVDEMVTHLEIDDRGVPTWWTRAVPTNDGELPIDSA